MTSKKVNDATKTTQKNDSEKRLRKTTQKNDVKKLNDAIERKKCLCPSAKG
jgi:hypothetical protein